MHYISQWQDKLSYYICHFGWNRFLGKYVILSRNAHCAHKLVTLANHCKLFKTKIHSPTPSWRQKVNKFCNCLFKMASFVNSWIHIYRTRAIISRGFIFFTPFSKTISLFLRRFFQKILSLCMAYNQERLVIKSSLWWRVYGR